MEIEGGIRDEQGWMKRKNKEENAFSLSHVDGVEGRRGGENRLRLPAHTDPSCDQELLDWACKCTRLPEAPPRQPVTDLRPTEELIYL